MEYRDVITSPYHGVVKEVMIKKDGQIDHKKTLFRVLTGENRLENINVDYRGMVQSLEVEIGEEVIPGMVLAYVEEDWSNDG